MRGKIGIFRRGGMIVLTFVLAAGYPFMAIADTQDPTTTAPTTTDTTAPPATDTTTPPATDPTTPSTDTSTPPPSSDTTTPPKPTYTFNPTTNTWDSSQWQFNPTTGTYEHPPAPVVVTPPPVTDTTKASADTTVNTNATAGTDVNSAATTGDATVSGNTTAGNATSGDAVTAANVLNVVNSTIGTSDNQKVAQFTQDVYGDVTGDIILSPLILKAFLEAQAPTDLKTTTTANTNLGINNNLNLNAMSGDATVSGNTTAGNATTGSATAVANVVNVLNSLIATQQSFIGTINIYGNLNGDILIAPDFIPQMIANNGGASNNTSTTSDQLSSNDTQSIVNNISAAANSGAASVFGNTSAGNATTGDALSNVVIFNLSGHQVIAQNSLLVFVNVLGKWVGVIVDAPAGATAAMLSNGVSSSNYTPDLTVNAQSNQGITNTIAVNAQTGDAVVSNNTTAGNAVSGAAKAMANVANVSGDQFSTTGWFGVLFINVFQDWFGSFGIDTPYGNIPTNIPTQQQQTPVQFIPAVANVTHTTKKVRVIDTRSFDPSAAVLAAANINGANDTSSIANPDPADILGATNTTHTPSSQDDYRLWIIAGSIVVVGLSAIGLKRLFR